MIALWNLAAAVEQALGEKGKDLYQGDARVALIEIGPLRVVHGNTCQGFIQQVLVPAAIKGG